jgi:hypothetical protein
MGDSEVCVNGKDIQYFVLAAYPLLKFSIITISLLPINSQVCGVIIIFMFIIWVI